MPRHHSPDQKAVAIQCLNSNGGDIVTTSFQTGIPIRTLYTWRKELWIQQVKQQQSLPATPPIEMPQFDNDVDALLDIRGQALKFANAISSAIQERLPTHSNTAWMLDRIRAQNSLVAMILKIDAYLKPHLDQRREAATDAPTTIYGWLDSDDDEFEDELPENDLAYRNVGAFN